MYRQRKRPPEKPRGLEMLGRATRFVRESKADAHLRFKGGIVGKYGTEVHDPIQTARHDRLLLDSGAQAFGNGYFDTDKGEFVRDSRAKEGEVCPEPVDRGPVIPGDKFLLFGKGTPPGTDHPMVTAEDGPDRERELENVRAFYKLRQTGIGPEDGQWKATSRQHHDDRDHRKAMTYLHDRD